MKIFEQAECLHFQFSTKKEYILSPVTGVILEDGFSRRTEQRLKTVNEGNQQTLIHINEPVIDFWIRTIEDIDIPVRLQDDIALKQGQVITLIKAEDLRSADFGWASLANYGTERYHSYLHFARINFSTINARFLIFPFSLSVLTFILFFLFSDIITKSWMNYSLCGILFSFFVGFLFMDINNKSDKKKIQTALKAFTISSYGKVDATIIRKLGGYCKATPHTNQIINGYQMNNNIHIGTATQCQIGSNNLQTNYASNEVNLTPPKEEVGKAMDAIEGKRIDEKSFPKEVRECVKKELKSYFLGEIQTLTRSTAQWVLRLVINSASI